MYLAVAEGLRAAVSRPCTQRWRVVPCFAWCQLEPAETSARGCFSQSPIVEGPWDFVAASSLSSSWCRQSGCSCESQQSLLAKVELGACDTSMLISSSTTLSFRWPGLSSVLPSEAAAFATLDNISAISIHTKCAASIFQLHSLAVLQNNLSKVFPATAGRKIP